MNKMEDKAEKETCQEVFPKEMFQSWKSVKLGRVEQTFDLRNYPYIPEVMIKTINFYSRFNTKNLFIDDSGVVKHHYSLKQGYQMLVDSIYECLNVIPKLSRSGIQLYSIVKMLVQLNYNLVSAENVVTVRLKHEELKEFIPIYDMDERTFRRARKELVDNEIISPIPEHKHDYFINFMIFFCGNRDLFIEYYNNTLKYSRDIDRMQRIRNENQ